MTIQGGEDISSMNENKILPDWINPNDVPAEHRTRFTRTLRPCDGYGEIGCMGSQYASIQLTIREIEGGSKRREYKCAKCGKNVSSDAVKHIEGLNPVDDEAYFQQLEMDFEKKFQETERHDILDSPDDSPERKAYLRQFLEMDDSVCRVCGGKAIVPHHRNYDNVGHEEPEDIVSLCLSCHEAIHFLNPFEARYMALRDDWQAKNSEVSSRVKKKRRRKKT